MEGIKKISKIKDKIMQFYNNLKTSYKMSFYLTFGIALVTAFIIYIVFKLEFNTFFNNNSDDIIQYYPYIEGFFKKIKTNSFSLYDTSLFGGTSFYSALYYIPLDIFLLVAFILSYMMPTAYAYFISLLLKIVASALVFFLLLRKRNIKPLVATISSLIYASSGLVQTYTIFPVFLGIMFYAPLGALMCEYFYSHKNVVLMLIPVFVILVSIYNFYCAYMVLAFVSFYFIFVSSEHYKFILKEKSFYLNFIIFFILILLGVAISLVILLPEAFYILNESSRSNDGKDFYWYYSIDHYTKSKISIRHYFTLLVNMYIPNNPQKLCLSPSGEYIREHATLYMSIGFFIYFINAFMHKGAFKLKLWTIFFDFLFLIPLAAMVFSLQTKAYVRWLFIPFIFNMLTASYGMNKRLYNKNIIINILILLSVIIGLALLIYIYNTNTEYFIHYDKYNTSDMFSFILIGSIIFLIIYIIYLIINFIFIRLKNIHINLMPILIISEIIFSFQIVFYTAGSTNYINEHNRAKEHIDYLNNFGYDYSKIERINLYTEDRYMTNANIAFLNTNPNNFFQSFYDTSLNRYSNKLHDQAETSWSRRSMYGLSLIDGVQYNVKYVIGYKDIYSYITSQDETELCKGITLPKDYYDHYQAKFRNDYDYYIRKNNYSFIIYDKVMYKNASYFFEPILNDLMLLDYAYVDLPDEVIGKNLDEVFNNSFDYNLEKEDLEILNNAKTILKSDIDVNQIIDSYIALNPLKYSKEELTSNVKTESDYIIFDLLDNSFNYNNIFNRYALSIYPFKRGVAKETINPSTRALFYLRDKDTKELIPGHYSNFYLEDLNRNYDKLYVKVPHDETELSIRLISYDKSYYDSFIQKQNSYSNRIFEFKNDNFHISYKSNKKPHLIKLPIGYADGFVCDKNYAKVVSINGGFVGLLIDSKDDIIDLNLKFIPKGYSNSFKITKIGCIIYIIIVSVIVDISVIKYKRSCISCKRYL